MGSSTYEADSKADLTETTTNNNNNNTATKHESTKAKFNQFNSKARKKKEQGASGVSFFDSFPCFSDTTTTLEQQKVDIDNVSNGGGMCSCTKCCFCGCSDSSSSQRKISSCNSSYDNEPTAHPSSSSPRRTCSIL